MAKNPYKVLTRPNTKKADIIRTTLPGAGDGCHVYATCASTAQAKDLCYLLNLGLEVNMELKTVKTTPKNKVLMPKPKRKARAR